MADSGTCAPAQAVKPSQPLPDLSGLRILVLDDDLDSRTFLRAILERCGATVIEADNSGTARHHVDTMPLDLIVADLALPHEDGVSFVRWLRARPGHKGGAIAVVAVTAYYERYPGARLQGFAAYFQKPISVDDFLRTIAAMFNRTPTP